MGAAMNGLGLTGNECRGCGKPLTPFSNHSLRLHRTCEADLFDRLWPVELR